MKYYNDSDREERAAELNELALDFMKRLANVENKAARQESLLRHTIDRLQLEKRDLEMHLRREVGDRLSREAAYSEDALKVAVDAEMQMVTRGLRR